MAYGLTTEGLLTKTLGLIRDDINAAIRQAFGASVKLDDQSIFGQLVGIIAERIAQLWELSAAIYSSQDPDSASGSALEALAALTGTLRQQATYSVVPLVLAGVDTTVIPADSKVEVQSTSVEFQTTDSATLGTTDLGVWADTTPYALGDVIANAGMIWYCVDPGTSQLPIWSGPGSVPGNPFRNDVGTAGTYDNVTDGTVIWAYVGDGDAFALVNARATVTGPVEATAFDIHGTDSIVNSVTGWQGVLNPSNAQLGNDIMSDADLRILREQELATGGSSTVDALRAELLEVPDVVSVTVFQNNTDAVVDGMSPHSVEALVRGPLSPTSEFDQSIWDALLAGGAAGIATNGSIVGVSEDDSGIDHTMRFNRPTNVNIYVDIELTKDPEVYPTDGDDLVKEAIVAYGDLQPTGKNVVSSGLIGAIFAAVPGVLDITVCHIGLAANPTLSTTIPIALRELAVFSVARCTCVSVDGTP